MYCVQSVDRTAGCSSICSSLTQCRIAKVTYRRAAKLVAVHVKATVMTSWLPCPWCPHQRHTSGLVGPENGADLRGQLPGGAATHGLMALKFFEQE
jgi:hypothetical protein